MWIVFPCCSQYRVLMSGCWRALFFFLGPSPRAGQGDGRHFFSGSQQYRSTLIHHTWENSLTQPLLEGMEGITESLEPAIHENNPVLLYLHTSDEHDGTPLEVLLLPTASIAFSHGELCFFLRRALLLPMGNIASPYGEYCLSWWGVLSLPTRSIFLSMDEMLDFITLNLCGVLTGRQTRHRYLRSPPAPKSINAICSLR